MSTAGFGPKINKTTKTDHLWPQSIGRRMKEIEWRGGGEETDKKEAMESIGNLGTSVVLNTRAKYPNALKS